MLKEVYIIGRVNKSIINAMRGAHQCCIVQNILSAKGGSSVTFLQLKYLYYVDVYMHITIKLSYY
jgi:hypothetical protein